MVMSNERNERRLLDGSPTFYYVAGTDFTVSANGQTTLGLCNNGKGEKKYFPLNSISVKNTTASDLRVVCGQHQLSVPANSIITKTDIAYGEITVYELSGNAVNSGVYVNAWFEPLTDSQIGRMNLRHRLMFGGWNL